MDIPCNLNAQEMPLGMSLQPQHNEFEEVPQPLTAQQRVHDPEENIYTMVQVKVADFQGSLDPNTLLIGLQ